MKLIAQGAESKLYKNKDLLIKHRVRKSYRISVLDNKLRKLRTRAEARMIKRASKLINVPKIKEISKFKITMEFIDGAVLRDIISSLNEDFKPVIKQVGVMIGKLHKNDYIHGDLTTSNMVLKGVELFLIDFGLSEVNKSVEAKAVDLHVLKQALKSKHHKQYNKAWKLIKNYYLKEFPEGKEVINRLRKVESRGRYKKKVCV